MALTSARKTQRREGVQGAAPVLALAAIHEGGLVALKAGNALAARAGTGADAAAQAAEIADHVVVGIAEQSVTGGAANGDERVPFRAGCFLLKNAAGGDAITRADIGKPAYAVDDETVSDGHAVNTRPKAGTIVDVEDAGVWVRVGI